MPVEASNSRIHVVLLAVALASSSVAAQAGGEPTRSRDVTARPASPPASEPAAKVRQLHFYSDFWMNLHHTLYAAAWAGRREGETGRGSAGKLPSPLDAPFTSDERAAWLSAVDYYDEHLASKHLLFDDDMTAIKTAVAAGDAGRRSLDTPLRAVLEDAAPVYRRYFWDAHDRANREWIAAQAKRVQTIAPAVIPRLEGLYETRWFTTPIRIDIVRVANSTGAYTTVGPPTHATIASGDSGNEGWPGVEIVFHEMSHALANLRRPFADALGDRTAEHGRLWHAVLFYLTGSAVQEALQARGVDYVPYVYSLGMWSRYRQPIEENWKPYFEGTTTLRDAVTRTVADLSPSP